MIAMNCSLAQIDSLEEGASASPTLSTRRSSRRQGFKFSVEQSKSHSVQYFIKPLIGTGLHRLDVPVSQKLPEQIGKLKKALCRARVPTLTCIKQTLADRKMPC